MCRLYGFRATECTKVECSLVKALDAWFQPEGRAQSDPADADGWGIACYRDLRRTRCLPEIIRHETAVFGTDGFQREAPSTFARTVLAHVRLATVGYVGTLNSHPFHYQSWTFAHQGTIPAFQKLQAQLESESGNFQNCRLGATDSEQLFLWLLSRLDAEGVDLCDADSQKVRQTLANAAAELAERVGRVSETPAKLTFLLSNGPLLFSCRFNSPLFRLVREGIEACGICGVSHVPSTATSGYRAVVFASEPITSEPWEAVTNGTITSVGDDRSLRLATTRMETPHTSRMG